MPINPSYSGDANMIVYGVCAGYHPYFGDIAFITEDMGSKVQLWGFKNKSLSLIHEFKNADAAQSEGCVYDDENQTLFISCLLYTSPSPRDKRQSRMPSSA